MQGTKPAQVSGGGSSVQKKKKAFLKRTNEEWPTPLFKNLIVICPKAKALLPLYKSSPSHSSHFPPSPLDTTTHIADRASMSISSIEYCCSSSMEVVARLLAVVVEWLLRPFVQPAAASNSRTTSVSAQAVRKGLHVAAYGETAAAAAATCAVCLSEVHGKDRVWELRNCRHVFHEGCLGRWMDHDERVSCPLCRAPLMTQAQARGDELPSQPSWAVERLLYLFADDLLLA